MFPPSKHFRPTPPNADDSEDDERRNPLREESDTSSTDQEATNDLDPTDHFRDDIPPSLGMTVHVLPLLSTFSRSHEFSQSTTSSLFNIPQDQVNDNDHNPTVNIDPVIPDPAPQLPATEESVTGSGQGDNLITTMVSFDIIQRYPLLDEEVSNDSIADEMVGPPAKKAKLLAQIGSTLDQAPLDERDETTTTKKFCSLIHQYSIASVVLRVVSDIQPIEQ